MPTGIAVDQVFAALADKTRRDLLELLGEQGAASASSLASELPISRQAIAVHLRLLEGAGLVTSLRRGRELCFAVQPRTLAVTARWLDRVAAHWDEQRAIDSHHG